MSSQDHPNARTRTLSRHHMDLRIPGPDLGGSDPAADQAPTVRFVRLGDGVRPPAAVALTGLVDALYSIVRQVPRWDGAPGTAPAQRSTAS